MTPPLRLLSLRFGPAGLVAAALAAVAAAGCDSQADTNYRGEPLVRLHGTITSSIADPPSTLLAVLGWSNTAHSGGDVGVLDELVVETEFPASFQMDIYQPPDELALNDYTQGGRDPAESRIGVAHIVAWPAGFDPNETDDGDGPDRFGVAERHLLVFVESDVQPNTTSARIVGGALDAGFHLMDVIDNGQPGCTGDFDCMRPAPDGLDTPIQIRIDLADLLDFPEWT